MLPFTTDLIAILTASTATDAYNNTTLSWTSPASVTVLGSVQPDGSLENRGARSMDQTISSYRVYLPAGTAVTASNRLLWNDLTLDVDGDPQRFPSPFGGEHHVELRAVITGGE